MVKYGYYTVSLGKSRKGVVTVAVTRPDRNDPEQFHVASFAFCSPKDMFRKALGRRIADGRLSNSKGPVVTVSLRGTVSEVIDRALGEAVSQNLAPSWFIKAYKRNNVSYGLKAAA